MNEEITGMGSDLSWTSTANPRVRNTIAMLVQLGAITLDANGIPQINPAWTLPSPTTIQENISPPGYDPVWSPTQNISGLPGFTRIGYSSPTYVDGQSNGATGGSRTVNTPLEYINLNLARARDWDGGGGLFGGGIPIISNAMDYARQAGDILAAPVQGALSAVGDPLMNAAAPVLDAVGENVITPAGDVLGGAINSGMNSGVIPALAFAAATGIPTGTTAGATGFESLAPLADYGYATGLGETGMMSAAPYSLEAMGPGAEAGLFGTPASTAANTGMVGVSAPATPGMLGTPAGTAPLSAYGYQTGLAEAAPAIGLLGTEIPVGQAVQGGLNMLGGYLQGDQARSASETAANAQIEAARIAAEAARFRPIGVTNRFGSSQFGYDAQGNLTSAGYTVSPELAAQQDALMGMAPGMLQQFQGSQAATAPMGVAGQRAMELGQGYLQRTPQEQAAQYMAEQQALLAPSRERGMADLQARLQAQGRMGLMTGGTSTLNAANPELEAYYNALRMQDLGLAAQATQGGQQYAQFGTQMAGAGGNLMQGMFGTQTAALAPWQATMGGVKDIEAMGQDPFNLGMNIGAKGMSPAAAQAILSGRTGAAKTMLPANAWSPFADAVRGVGMLLKDSRWGQ